MNEKKREKQQQCQQLTKKLTSLLEDYVDMQYKRKQSINQSEVHIRIGSWIIILQLGPLWDELKVLGSSVQSSIAGEWGSSKSPYCCDCNWIDDRNPHRYSYNSDDRYRHEIFQRMILSVYRLMENLTYTLSFHSQCQLDWFFQT